MARLILDEKCGMPEASRRVAKRVVDQGDAYDWGACVRVRSAESLARRLSDQWKRDGRGERLLAEDRSRRLDEQKHVKQEERRTLQKCLGDLSASIDLAAKALPYTDPNLGKYLCSPASFFGADHAAIIEAVGPLDHMQFAATKTLQTPESDALRRLLEGLSKAED